MKIHFVTEGELSESAESAARSGCDVLALGFHGLGEIDYRRELAGETAKLEDMAILSRELGCVVVSGCYTDSCGVRHKSAAIAEKGKILGVADMLHAAETDFRSGAHLKVYETGAGKIGLCVGEDLFYPSVAETLALCDADVIFNVFGEAEDFAPQLMLRASAFCSGVPICMSGEGIAQISSPEGEILMRSAKRECDFTITPSREYRLVTVRTRGLARRRREDF